MARVSQMLADGDFIKELGQNAETDEQSADESGDYKFERDDDQEEDDNSISAQYGSEDESAPPKKKPQEPVSDDESELDAMMQGMEEDEL